VAQSFADDFNRGDSSNLGANWTEGLDGASGFAVASNHAEPASSSCNAAWASPCDSDDNFSQVTFSVWGSGEYGGLWVRTNGATGTNALIGYMFRQDVTSDNVKLYKRVTGTYTQLGSTVGNADSAGDVLRMEVSGSDLSCQVNGTPLIEVTDTAISSGKYVGIRATATGSDLDDWSGGDLGGAAPGRWGVVLVGA